MGLFSHPFFFFFFCPLGFVYTTFTDRSLPIFFPLRSAVPLFFNPSFLFHQIWIPHPPGPGPLRSRTIAGAGSLSDHPPFFSFTRPPPPHSHFLTLYWTPPAGPLFTPPIDSLPHVHHPFVLPLRGSPTSQTGQDPLFFAILLFSGSFSCENFYCSGSFFP